MKTLQIALILSLAILPLFAITWAQEKPDSGKAPAIADDPKAIDKKPTIRIGRDTTYLTEPLHPEGGIDYRLAIEQTFHQKVKPQDNAAIPLMQAFGPSLIPQAQRAEFFQKLGMQPPPTNGAYFVPDAVYSVNHGFREYVLGSTIYQVLAEEENPNEDSQVLDWLRINQKPLDLMVEASKRTEFSTPLIYAGNEKPHMLIEVHFPLCKQISGAAKALLVRACQHIHNKDFDAAWEEMMACHRLARLLEKAPFTMPTLHATGIDAQIHQVLEFFLNACPAKNSNAHQRLKDFLDHPIRADYETKLMTDRWLLLDTIYLASTGELPAIQSGEISLQGFKEKMTITLMRKFFHWEVILQEANRYSNEALEIHRRLPSKGGLQDLAAIDQKLEEWKNVPVEAKPGDTLSAVQQTLIIRRNASLDSGKQLIVFASVGFSKNYTAHRRHQVQYDMSSLMLALEAFHAEEQDWPEDLKALTPKYLPKLPRSPFLDQDYHYTKDMIEGYTLSTLREDQGLPRFVEDLPSEIQFTRTVRAEENNDQTTLIICAASGIVVVIAGLWYWRRKPRQ